MIRREEPRYWCKQVNLKNVKTFFYLQISMSGETTAEEQRNVIQLSIALQEGCHTDNDFSDDENGNTTTEPSSVESSSAYDTGNKKRGCLKNACICAISCM